ncbi:hypothetical protein VNO77_23347 [Canavalia gladiata]|uniref:Uncharacterized protein n=1 Tax=Canavalia gladiata TaxID=3824 RepID=A0AAN9L6R9_CANGL
MVTLLIASRSFRRVNTAMGQAPNARSLGPPSKDEDNPTHSTPRSREVADPVPTHEGEDKRCNSPLNRLDLCHPSRFVLIRCTRRAHANTGIDDDILDGMRAWFGDNATTVEVVKASL